MSKPREVSLRENGDEGEPPDPPESEASDTPSEEPANESALRVYGDVTSWGALREDASLPPGSVWRVCLIRQGWSKNGYYYTKEALISAIPLFEGKAAQYYSWGGGEAGHIDDEALNGDEGPAGNNVGVYSNVEAVEEADGRVGIYANFVITHPTFHEQMRRYMLAQEQYGTPIPLGFSIHGRGYRERGTAEGRVGDLVTKLTAILETTVVTNPAAGGRFALLVAGLDTTKKQKKKENNYMLKQWLRSRRLAAKKSLAGLESLTETAVLHECVAELRAVNLKDDLGLAAALGLVIEWLGAGKTEEATQLVQKLVDEMGVSAPAVEAPPVPEEKKPPFMEAGKPDPVAEATKMLQEAKLERCETELERQIQDNKLEGKAADIVREQFAGKLFEKPELSAFIAKLREALGAHVPESGVEQTVTEAQRASIVVDQVDKFRVGLDLMMGYDYNRDSSLTEAQKSLYKDLSKDGRAIAPARLYEKWFDQTPTVGGRAAGPNALLREATSADFAVMLGTSTERRMIQAYDEVEDRTDELVKIVPDIANFKTQTRIQFGGFTDFKTVGEGAAYPTLATPFEDSLTYSLTKRGGMFQITLEMLANDDLRKLRQLATELGRAARHNKKRFIYSLVIGASALTSVNADLSWDGAAIYHASHANTGTSALSESTLFAGRTAIRNQRRIASQTTITEAYTSGGNTLTVASFVGITKGMFLRVDSEFFRVTTTPTTTAVAVVGAQLGSSASDHNDDSVLYVLSDSIAANKFNVVVPSELEGTLLKIINSELTPGTANNDRNIFDILKSSIVPHAVDAQYLLGDMNNWYMVADQNQVESIEVGYLNGQVLPEILLANQALVGNTLTNDAYDYKIRQIIGGSNIDHNGRYAGIVA